MNAEKRRQIFQRLAEATPHPTTELVHHSTFELLISVILSAQATDAGVNKATGPLFAVWGRRCSLSWGIIRRIGPGLKAF